MHESVISHPSFKKDERREKLDWGLETGEETRLGREETKQKRKPAVPSASSTPSLPGWPAGDAVIQLRFDLMANFAFSNFISIPLILRQYAKEFTSYYSVG